MVRKCDVFSGAGFAQALSDGIEVGGLTACRVRRGGLPCMGRARAPRRIEQSCHLPGRQQSVPHSGRALRPVGRILTGIGLNSVLESKCHLVSMIACASTPLGSQCLEVSLKCSDECGASVLGPRSFQGHCETGEGGNKEHRFGFRLDRWVDPASELAAF
jgi:hypothetical protein